MGAHAYLLIGWFGRVVLRSLRTFPNSPVLHNFPGMFDHVARILDFGAHQGAPNLAFDTKDMTFKTYIGVLVRAFLGLDFAKLP